MLIANQSVLSKRWRIPEPASARSAAGAPAAASASQESEPAREQAREQEQADGDAGMPRLLGLTEWLAHLETRRSVAAAKSEGESAGKNGDDDRAAAGQAVAVLLEPDDDPHRLDGNFDGLAAIAIRFVRFNDGRGYTLARILRNELSWQGPLVAVGEVLRDQLQPMARCGFDQFQLREDQRLDRAADALSVFSSAYQTFLHATHAAVTGAPLAAPGIKENVVTDRSLDQQSSERPAFRPISFGPHDDKAIAALGRITDAVHAHAPAAFSCSFGLEDMVIVDLLARSRVPVEIFTLDTGRLHEETHALMTRVRERYDCSIEVYAPQADALKALLARDGPNAFYQSLQARHACCQVRKVEPLGRALEGKALWITGLRRGQAATRADVPVLERDDARRLWKLNPLADWSADDVRLYLERNQVPINALHARGYPSIGCAPCTRAVAPGEDERAGRWWWEAPQQKECGLHVGGDGRLHRSRSTEDDHAR